MLPKDSIFNIPELKDISTDILNDSSNANLYFQRAEKLHKHGDDSLAAIDYITAYQLDTTNAKYTSALGILFFENKNISNAMLWFKKTLMLNPNDINTHLRIAKLCLYIQKYEEGFSHTNQVLRQDINNSEAYYIKGMMYKDMGKKDKAISSFQTAIQTNPKNSEAYLQMGFYKEDEKDSICLKYFENAFNADSNITGLYAQAMYFQNRNQFERAKSIYKKCTQINSRFSNAYYNLGWIYLEQDSNKKALYYYDSCINISVNYIEAYVNRGVAKERLGYKKEAVIDFETALTLDPNNQLAKNGLKRNK